MSEFASGSLAGALAYLAQRGARYATVIDLGCADGTFSLNCWDMRLLPGPPAYVNVEANAIYEESLKKIQEVVSGSYAIAAICDFDGEVELHSGSHAYWASVLPHDHPYWSGSHNKPGKGIKVQSLKLDTLVRRFSLKPPYLLKLDLQGGEFAALRGGEEMLKETDTVICETENDEFPRICEFLTGRNYSLFDLTELARSGDGMLYQFYPIFLNRRLDYLIPKVPWKPEFNEAVIQAMDQRRKVILEGHAKILSKYSPSRPRQS